MRTNLSTFPKTVEGENRDEADLWAENFKKEVERIIKACDSQPKQTRNGSIYLMARREAFKEVLGK